MAKGTIGKPEWSTYTDGRSGVRVTRLTNYKAHSHHVYFTNSGWYDSGRKLLFGSDRNNKTNLYSVDLQSGEIMQLTDLDQSGGYINFQQLCVNPTRDEAYFWYGRSMIALNLKTLEERVIYERPEGFIGSMPNVTADGRYVCTAIQEDVSDRINIGYSYIYAGFNETFELKPLCHIVRIATSGDGSDIVHTEKTWLNHVNTSPTQPELLTFCHEGPWDRVHRIWGLNLSSGKTWKIRERREPGERIGHEYWLADGLHVGYHGTRVNGDKFLGIARYDDTGHVETAFPFYVNHIHSNDASLIVGDGESGGATVKLWTWNGQSYDQPRALCEHRGSSIVQKLHTHPRFSADGKQVVFTSDMSGYGNVYLADVPDDLTVLPVIEEL
jgi:oligogalacturonide lyase